MSQVTEKSLQTLTQSIAARPESVGLSLQSLLHKLPSWALIPLTVALFALLLTDSAIVDPLPFVDEAALLYAFLSGMKVLASRRRSRAASEETTADPAAPSRLALAPGQPDPSIS